MSEIITLITEPRIWVTIFLGIIVSKIVSNAPKQIRGIVRKKRLSRLTKVRVVRRNIAEVNFESMKTNAYFVFFLLTCVIYLIWLTMGPLAKIAEHSVLVTSILAFPIYVVEIIWLQQCEYSKQLIKARKCIK